MNLHNISCCFFKNHMQEIDVGKRLFVNRNRVLKHFKKANVLWPLRGTYIMYLKCFLKQISL